MRGFWKTLRGAKGGLTLACDPATTTVLDVLTALRGPMNMSPCSADSEYCERCGGCEYHGIWKHADRLMQDYFESITLEKLFSGEAR